MPPWDNKLVYHSYFINKNVQKVIDDENNKKEAKTKNSLEKYNKKVPKNF